MTDTKNSLSLQLRSLASATHDAAMIQPFRDMAKLAEELEARSLAPPPAKELSDEEIEHIVVESIPEMSHVGLAPNDASALKMARAFMERGIRYARDNGYLSPAPPPSGAVVEAAKRALFRLRQKPAFHVNVNGDYSMTPFTWDQHTKSLAIAAKDLDTALSASSPSEPTVDEQTEKIVEAVQLFIVTNLDRIGDGGSNAFEYPPEHSRFIEAMKALEVRIKSLLSR